MTKVYGRDIGDVKELALVKVGEVINLASLGQTASLGQPAPMGQTVFGGIPAVYEGMINGRYAFMTPILPGEDRANPNVIHSFRGDEPYITKNGRGILDFRRWSDKDDYSEQTHKEIWEEKSDLVRRAGFFDSSEVLG